jgi:hypothetical protein
MEPRGLDGAELQRVRGGIWECLAEAAAEVVVPLAVKVTIAFCMGLTSDKKKKPRKQ